MLKHSLRTSKINCKFSDKTDITRKKLVPNLAFLV